MSASRCFRTHQAVRFHRLRLCNSIRRLALLCRRPRPRTHLTHSASLYNDHQLGTWLPVPTRFVRNTVRTSRRRLRDLRPDTTMRFSRPVHIFVDPSRGHHTRHLCRRPSIPVRNKQPCFAWSLYHRGRRHLHPPVQFLTTRVCGCSPLTASPSSIHSLL